MNQVTILCFVTGFLIGILLHKAKEIKWKDK